MFYIYIYIALIIIYYFALTLRAKSTRGGNLENEKSRTLELVLGILGGVFGLLGGVFALIFSAFAPSVGVLGFSAILASIAGLIGAIFVSSNPKYGGIILIISAVWLLISISAFGILGAVLLGVAGLVALIRN